MRRLYQKYAFEITAKTFLEVVNFHYALMVLKESETFHFLVGLYLAIKTMWSKRHETTNTQGDQPRRSSHETVD